MNPDDKRILVVDDDTKSRQAVTNFLKIALGYDVTQAANGKEALQYYTEKPFQIIITDIKMPEMNGIELLKKVKSLPEGKQCAVILMTGFADIETALEALRSGAYDYLHKPVEAVTLSAVINRLFEDDNYILKAEEPSSLKHGLKGSEGTNTGYVINIPKYGKVGIFSPQMRALLDMAHKFHSDRSIPVLIEGETGTGKEAFARIVHHGQSQSQAPFISINCTAIAEGLFESELFGYEAGAFTGANKSGSIGKLELAQEGTIFLDEIGDLPLPLQPKLLRVLEEREMFRIGGNETIPLNIRIVAATNAELSKKVEEGKFRSDLFHRLNRGKLFIPPLRNRREEIIQLSFMLLEKLSEDKTDTFNYIVPEARSILLKHNWPGNVRELVNCLERVTLLYKSKSLEASHLSFLNNEESFNTTETSNQIVLGEISLPEKSLPLHELEDEIILKALKKFDGNQSKTAEYLGIARTTLRSKMKSLNY